MKTFAKLIFSAVLLIQTQSLVFAGANGCNCQNCACIKESNCGCCSGGECNCATQAQRPSCCEGCAAGKSCNCEVK